MQKICKEHAQKTIYVGSYITGDNQDDPNAGKNTHKFQQQQKQKNNLLLLV